MYDSELENVLYKIRSDFADVFYKLKLEIRDQLFDHLKRDLSNLEEPGTVYKLKIIVKERRGPGKGGGGELREHFPEGFKVITGQFNSLLDVINRSQENAITMFRTG